MEEVQTEFANQVANSKEALYDILIRNEFFVQKYESKCYTRVADESGYWLIMAS